MGNRWGNSGNSVRLYFLGSKITADGDCSHEIKGRLVLGRKAMINLDSIFKIRDITLPTKVHLVKAEPPAPLWLPGPAGLRGACASPGMAHPHDCIAPQRFRSAGRDPGEQAAAAAADHLHCSGKQVARPRSYHAFRQPQQQGESVCSCASFSLSQS